MTIPVSLIIASTSSALLDNVQGQLGFLLAPKAGNPPAQSVNVRNGGTGTLNWTASTSTSDGGKWITLNLAAGTAPSNFTVAINAAALPYAEQVAGTYTGEVALQTVGDSSTIPVSVVVGANGFNPLAALTFSEAKGGSNPASQTITASSSGTNFEFSVLASTATGGNWLALSHYGNACCITPEAIAVAVNPSPSLAAGTYSGQITMSQYPNDTYAITVPVYLVIH